MSEKTDFFNKDFDALAEKALSFYHCPGLSIGIIHKGKTYANVWVPLSPSGIDIASFPYFSALSDLSLRDMATLASCPKSL